MTTEDVQPKRAGIAVMVGRSNAGKSTLLNSLIGTKVAITTPTAQTTRHTIHGILNDDRGQAVFVDTPGLFKRVPDILTKRLNEQARESLDGVDVILHVVDPTRHVGEEEDLVKRLVSQAKAPKILVLNKRDTDRPYIDEYLAWQDDYDATVDVSALNGSNLAELRDAVFRFLPEGEPLYPPEQISDKDQTFRIAELIREKAFLTVRQEVPYTLTVDVTEIARREDGMVYIAADIITTSPRYRKMLIGTGGHTIKKIGKAVRKELEIVTGDRVYLDLEVRVDPKWQERML